MSCFVNEQEIARLKMRIPGGMTDRLYTILRERTRRNTAEETLVQSSDTQEWYHLVWERMADAGFVYRMEQDERLGRWIHDRTMELVRLPLDAWYGPWYRTNLRRRGAGSLETSHIVLGVCEAYENAREVFREEEQQEIREALRIKGMQLCRVFADEINQEGKNGFNWFMVLLNGYGTAAVVLDESEEIAHAIELFHRFAAFYNKDSYGESVQYSNYASLHLAFLAEILIRSGYAKAEELPLASYGNLMEWYAASRQRMKMVERFGCPLPRTFAFGDSSNLFRPTGNFLAHIAVHCKTKDPKAAGLAAWLFETTYAQELPMMDELATFGFFNQFGYHSILMYPDMAAPMSPEKAGISLCSCFDVGHILIRDRWEEPTMALAVAAGYEPLKVAVHRHLDQNSFQLTIGKERMLIDPGHCCYRLHTQEKSKDETSHSNISIRYQGHLLRQRAVEPEMGRGEETVYNRLLAYERFQDLQVIISDATGLYEAPVKKVVRIWLVRVPDLTVVCDYVLAEEPVELITRLVANNRDNQLFMERHQDEHITLTRKASSLDIYQALNVADCMTDQTKLSFDWSYLHDYYHPLPNQDGQGKEGSALTYMWTDCLAREHRRIQVLIGKTEDIEKQYEVRNQDGEVQICCNGDMIFSLIMHPEQIVVCRNMEFGSWEY